MTTSPKQIVFVHLLNDYSGSPLVLSQVIPSLPDREYKKWLYISSSSLEGFLSGLDAVRTVHFRYRWKANGWLRLLSYAFSQVLLFFQLLRFYRKDVLIYINTLLPFGAALAGRLMGKKIIYHLHETSMKPPPLKAFLRFVANHTAESVIYVSHYLAAAEKMSRPQQVVIHNCLPPAFTDKAALHPVQRVFTRYAAPSPAHKPHRVLMLCSMKEYKGINEFVTLARMLANWGIEVLLGTVPVLGNLFDIGWKANRRNYALLASGLADPQGTRRRSWLFFAALCVLFAAMLLLPMLLFSWLTVHMLRALEGISVR